MKLRPMTRTQGCALISEIRAMAELPRGPNPDALGRAKEIRFQLQGQAWSAPYLSAKIDAAYRHLEVLLSSRRWQDVSSMDALRNDIKSACARALSWLEKPARADGAA
jgi:hypothetical protein